MIVLLAGCASSRHHDIDPANIRPTSMIYSPNGEPLNGGALGRPTCKEAMTQWFDRVDTNHDGVISHDEFIADAKIQFDRMDIDHNGYLLPEELERFRLPFRLQEPAAASIPDQATDSSQSGSWPRHGRAGRDNIVNGNTSGKFASSVVPDPVMSADTSNDFRVTFDEFMAQAERKFTALTIQHTGFLGRDDVDKTCIR